MADRRLRPPTTATQALEEGDSIEFALTEEVSPAPGRKAWVKFGTTSAVRPGESTREAVQRVSRFVIDGLDARIDELS